ncbi:DeoR/GlpR family DNA-binding transcription regulator [Paracoccus sp. (in: a-proteobacteria)]|uniref:DeoR/GlpR family DNA-binding transcription regulator n=1 Tax=Paracoccus sp. TaxID=267 RepID=UPI0026DFF977|nr:DeoR/GlpR family DNA-binding transcription regulator [Paracoccus sp. (in: a-proteobacteria)]MDO5646782.1 DeoR/GlpR family DNA-binding transcription regulator [Paracoccus sp. (in: a-proteobacteria)]
MDNLQSNGINQRHQQILDRLRRDGFADIHALQTALDVSTATIRRDLTELEACGQLRRTRGGAIVMGQVTQGSPTAVRDLAMRAEKARIGRATAAMIDDGDAVFISAGTTAFQAARLLAANKTLRFITNGLDTAALLTDAGAPHVHMIGGQLAPINRSFIGPQAIDQLRAFNVDKALLNIAAIDLDRQAICMVDPDMAATTRAMIEIAQTSILTADHTKFTRKAMTLVTGLDAIDIIVTDTDTRPLTADLPDPIAQRFVFC